VGKNYDAAFKALADDDPRGLLFLFAGVPLSQEVSIEALPRELTAPALQVDHVYPVRSGEREWIWHIEVQTHYRADVPKRILRYDLALALRYPGVEIQTTLVLLVERLAPRTVQSEKESDLGGLRLRASYKVIRMWELDPSELLESRRLGLLPWVGLMQATPAQFLKALELVEAAEDPALRARAVLLGGLRYDKKGIEALLEKMGQMFITEEILRESSVTKDFIRELEEKVFASGQAHEARRMVRRLIAARFPSLGEFQELDRVADTALLEQLMADLISAETPEAAAAAVGAALRQ
jgi:hypothetical protein